MKTTVIITLFLVSFSVLQAQNAFYDALYLKSRNDPELQKIVLTKEVKQLLLTYYSGKNEDDIDEDLLNQNPFFKNLFLFRATAGDRTSFTSGILSSIGGLDVTNIADGMARFMVERAKKELNVFFFDKFRDRLDTIVELQILFPNTASQLRIIGSEIYNYNAYITSLRESFEKDLSALFVNLPKLMDEEKYVKALDGFPELRLILKSSFYIISQLNSDVHPGDIIHEFPKDFGKDHVPDNFYNSIQVLDLFSQNLRSKDKNKYWIGSDSITMLFEETTFRIYMGLIYQRTSDNIVFITNSGPVNFKSDVLKPFGDNWNAANGDIKKFKDYISGFGSKIDAVNVSLKGIKSKSKDGQGSYKEIYLFINASLDFIDYSVSFGELPYIHDKVKSSNFFGFYHTYSFVARQGSDLYRSINNRDYGSAILNVIIICDTIFPDRIMNGQYNPIQSNTKNILKYGTFMANIVNAKSSQDVESIIESVALPAGSSRIKRESRFNIALNSYLGLYVGHEFVQGVTNWPVINNYAVSAPIGVSFTWGGLKCKPKSAGWGIGGFISIVDIGALASFRITANDSVDVAPNIKLQDIIAPGAFFTVNFPKSPFTLAIGSQVGPLLRSVDESSHELAKNVYWRLGMTLTVDIPLLNIYNQEKRKKN